MARIKSLVLLGDTTTVSTGAVQSPHSTPMTFTIEGETSAGAGAATVIIEANNGTGTVWATLETLSLVLGTTSTMDMGNTVFPWANVRARVSAISGTNATVRAWLACTSIY